MLPTNAEWLEIGFLLFGPIHALGCLLFALLVWFVGRTWSPAVRIGVLVVNLLLAWGPVMQGFVVGRQNESFKGFGLGIVAAEVIALLVLAAVLITRRPRAIA